MIEFDDSELLVALKKDSLEAYELLFKKYYKVLCLQAVILLKDTTQAEDLVQELFVQLWDKKSYRRIDQSLKSYLYSAVRNKCFNKLRKEKLEKQKKEEYKNYQLRKRMPVWIEQKELSAQIKRVLQEFPPQRLRVFTLIYLENKRYRDAAEEMGISINSVKTHLRLALKVLREKLESFK